LYGAGPAPTHTHTHKHTLTNIIYINILAVVYVW